MTKSISDPKNVEPMVDCGCCGRVHQNLAFIDCRAFRTCRNCGDGYHFRLYEAHLQQCAGYASENIVDESAEEKL